MFERTTQLERQETTSQTGVVAGILATDGEASDGHILNMSGGEIKEGAPLLFNHDHMDGHLGSWTEFTAGPHELRGRAQIELGGHGEKSEWRKDVAHLVSQGHIQAFSVRWDGVGEPVRRTDLDKDHPAFIDQEREADWSKLWGLYFDKWRLLEGSIVALPADQEALIGRMRSGPSIWQRVLGRMAGQREQNESDPAVSAAAMLEAFDAWGLEELIPYEFEDGRVFYAPRELGMVGMTLEDEPEAVTVSEDEAEGVMPEADTVVEDVTPSDPELSREDMESMLRDVAAGYVQSRQEFSEITELYRDTFRGMYGELKEEFDKILYQALGRVK